MAKGLLFGGTMKFYPLDALTKAAATSARLAEFPPIW